MAIENVAACISSGECIVLTKGVLNILYGFSIFAGILLLVLMLVAFFTPAIIFLKAKFKKGSLIYSINRGQQGQFLIATHKHEGIADVKGVGPFIITENSHTIEKRSKTPFYFAFGEFSSTLPLEYASIVNYLRETDNKITNINDLADLIGMKFDEEEKKWYKPAPDKLSEKAKERIKKIDVMIKPYKTIKTHDLAYMFPFNITPALIESRTQHLIGLKQAMFNKMTPQLVMMFIMILMGSTLAAVIAFKFLKTGDVATSTVETRTIIERIVQTRNLTG